MESGAVEWPVPPSAPRDEAAEAGGLRERKKRLMRQQLSDTASKKAADNPRGYPVLKAASEVRRGSPVMGKWSAGGDEPGFVGDHHQLGPVVGIQLHQ
jgi:hypothetical protein